MEPQELKLGDLRGQLIRQEETIIFALIERAQFACNAPVYSTSSESGIMPKGFDGSFLDFLLQQTERLHAQVRRYTAPDEMAFFPLSLPEPMLDALDSPLMIIPNAININRKIKSIYETAILPVLTPNAAQEGDDKNYGSAAVCDIAALQALSKRIHFGKFIAEAKFQANREKYSALIRARDSDGLMAELTNLAVEKSVLARVRLKASTYGQDPTQKDAAAHTYKLEPDVIMSLYSKWVMPLTKEVQVAYLLQRLDPPVVGYVGLSRPSDRGFTTAPVLAAQHCLARSASDNAHAVRFDAFADPAAVIAAVLSNAAHFGVVALESSDEGISRAVLRQIANSGLLITSEVWLVAGCVAVAPTNTTWPPTSSLSTSTASELASTSHGASHGAELLQVYGTQRNLARCSRWIARWCKGSAHVAVTDDAEALDAMAAAGAGAIAVVDGSIPAAELGRSDMTVVAEDLVDVQGRMRYAVIERCVGVPSGNDRTSLTFAMDGRSPGELSAALGAFHENKVNLTQIQSLPPEGDGSTFLFYIEADGHPEDPAFVAALAQLGTVVASHRIVGCYMHGGDISPQAHPKCLTPSPEKSLTPGLASSSPPVSSPAPPAEQSPAPQGQGPAHDGHGRIDLGGHKVACLGPTGTYSHQAVIRHFGGDTIAVTLPTIESVAHAVESGEVPYALLPWENSAGGHVTQAVAAIATTSCFAVHEVCSRIEHCLLFNGPLESITEVRSKAEALSQCAGFLNEHLPKAKRVPCESSAKAAQEAAVAGSGVAAIGTETAGALYGVQTLRRGVEDNHDNATRFLLVTKQEPPPALSAVTGGVRSPFRTLLRFSPQDGAESLPAALAALSRRAVPVMSVVTRPAGGSWRKTFLVECAGHREDAAVGAAVDELRRLCSSTRWLGSYLSGTPTGAQA